ncbi:MAG: NADH-quinone oxidoreductase subunit H [Sulfolobales archaeon]
MIRLLSQYLIMLFTGMALTTALPLLDGLERKFVRARIQSRVGPPVLQTYYDILKLFKKELLVTYSATKLFVLAPPISFFISVLALSLIPYSLSSSLGFEGDIILLVYLLVFSTLILLLGSLSSGNPIVEVSSSREISLVLTSELLVGITLAAIALKHGSLSMQVVSTKLLLTPSTIIAYVALLYYAFIKSARTPYDIAEAEPEIASGYLIEYSGPLLAFSILSNLTRRFLVSSMFVVIALGPLIHTSTSFITLITFRSAANALLTIGLSVLTYLLLGAASIIHGRYRVTHALESVKKYTLIPIISLMLAVMGL